MPTFTTPPTKTKNPKAVTTQTPTVGTMKTTTGEFEAFRPPLSISIYLLIIHTINNFSHNVCITRKNFFCVFYVEWRSLGNGHCKEDSQWQMFEAKNPKECQRKCQGDCKYITFDTRDISCLGYNSTDCNVVHINEQETWAKGIIVFVLFKMCNVIG